MYCFIEGQQSELGECCACPEQGWRQAVWIESDDLGVEDRAPSRFYGDRAFQPEPCRAETRSYGREFGVAVWGGNSQDVPVGIVRHRGLAAVHIVGGAFRAYREHPRGAAIARVAEGRTYRYAVGWGAGHIESFGIAVDDHAVLRECIYAQQAVDTELRKHIGVRVQLEISHPHGQWDPSADRHGVPLCILESAFARQQELKELRGGPS